MGSSSLEFGDIVLVEVPFTDQAKTKLRPALVLTEELDNVVVAGITSNVKMKGVFLPKSEGLIVDSVLKLNYIFTISRNRIRKKLIHLSEGKKEEVCRELRNKFKVCL